VGLGLKPPILPTLALRQCMNNVYVGVVEAELCHHALLYQATSVYYLDLCVCRVTSYRIPHKLTLSPFLTISTNATPISNSTTSLMTLLRNPNTHIVVISKNYAPPDALLKEV